MGKKSKTALPSFLPNFKSRQMLTAVGIIVMKMFIDFNDETNMAILRLLAGACFFAMMAVQLYMYYKLRFSPNAKQETVFVKNSQLYPDDFGIETKKAEPKMEITVAQYDSIKWFEQLKKLTMAVTIGLFIHLYFNAPIPLVLLCISQPINLQSNPLFKIHVLGKDPKKVPKLKRPWANQPMAIPFGNNGFLAKRMQNLKEEMEKAYEEDQPGATQAKVVANNLNRKKARKLASNK